MKRILRKIFPVFIIISLILILSSCNVFDVFSVDSLIRAPKLTGSYSQIQSAFENSVGTDVSLINPLMGDYRSAFVLFDFDTDGDDDAFVFYSKKTSPDEVHMNVLECIDSNWVSVGDITGNGSEVYEIEFVNLDNDTDLEFAVTWSLSDSKQSKTLSLYKLTNGTEEEILQSMAVVQISDYSVIDIDYDGQNEIFYIYSSFEGNFSNYNAAVFKIDFDKYVPVPVTDVVLSKNIAKILSVQTDTKNSEYSFYIDCQSLKSGYFTEILSFDYSNNALVRPQNDKGEYLTELTYRNDDIRCDDFNSDDIIEIPVQSIYEGSYAENSDLQQNENIYYTSYMQFSDNSLNTVSEYYINTSVGFAIEIDSFRKSTYIVFNSDTGSTQFRTNENVQSDNLLFSVSRGDNSTVENDFYVGVTALGKKFGFNQETILSLIQSY